FVAAVQSYKRDSALRPFPPRYLTGEVKDFEELQKDVDTLPNVRDLVRLGHGDGDRHLALVHWVLSSKSFAVKALQKEEFARLSQLTQSEGISAPAPAPAPDFVFELQYCDVLNTKFERTRAGRELIYAFHGSRLENFHSIIHNGLHCHLNKTSLFGEGTYLTSDLSMAILYSPHDSESIDRKRLRARNSEGGEVPEKYFVVTNNELLRVKYLLVYSQRRYRSRHAQGTSWLVRHHFAIMMGLYLLLLIFIGAFNSSAFQSFWHRMFR
ncbi:hypothetical protein cypCar_00041769, partial [Cyprinus carpio]